MTVRARGVWVGCAALVLLTTAVGAADIFRLEEAGVPRLRIEDTGTLRLLASGSQPAFEVTGTGSGKLMALIDGSTEALTVLDGGNVGIGTTAPSQRLEVNGNLRLSGGAPTYRIQNLATPTAASDAATKAYVDAAGGGGGGGALQFHRFSGSSVSSPYQTVLNLSGGGCLLGVRAWTTQTTGWVRITIDGVQVNDSTAGTTPRLYDGWGRAVVLSTLPYVQSLNIPFNALRVELRGNGGVSTTHVEVDYAR